MHGYRSTFLALQYALVIVTEFCCADGHRVTCRKVTMDWQTNFCWQ